MKNRETFYTDPGDYKLANQGVAKITFPPKPQTLDVLQGEVSTFVCDGAYAEGLVRIFDSFLGALGRDVNSPAVWISGFYGSGKSHLASMLAALWTNTSFPDGSNAEGLITGMPDEVKAVLKEFRLAAERHGGVLVAGDTLGTGPTDPIEAILGIILRAVNLPTDLRAAEVAFWLADQNILSAVMDDLGANFERDIRNFLLAPSFAESVLRTKPELAENSVELNNLLKSQFPEPPTVTVDLFERMLRQAITLNHEESPLTLIVLDEVQQFVRLDPDLVLKIQTMAERLASGFDGKVLLVATGQQQLSDVENLQKLIDRFPIQIMLGEADVDSVIRKTVLKKKVEAEKPIKKMLEAHAGEISRHLRKSQIAHAIQDNETAFLDWPILPSRKRLWERILRELDRTNLGGTLRGQLKTNLDAARAYGDLPLGNAVPADFLYERFSIDAYTAGILDSEIRDRIEELKNGDEREKVKARILMIIYMLGRISQDINIHGVQATEEVLYDLLVVDLSGDDKLRRSIPKLLRELQTEGVVLEVDGEWRLQTRESSEWEVSFKEESNRIINSQSVIFQKRSEMLEREVGNVLVNSMSIGHGSSNLQRKIRKVTQSEQCPDNEIPLTIFSAWNEKLADEEKEVAAKPVTDASIFLLIPNHQTRDQELVQSLVTWLAAERVLQNKGVPKTDAGREAKNAMNSRLETAKKDAKSIIDEVISMAYVVLPGGKRFSGYLPDSMRDAGNNVVARLFTKFKVADHLGWGSVYQKAMKNDPDAIKSVDHDGTPESHPVCNFLLDSLGSGRTGSELREEFKGSPYGWSQDAIDGALVVLANAGMVRVKGSDGRIVRITDLPRNNFGTCTFQVENTIISLDQRMSVRKLLSKLDIEFESGNEELALPSLLSQLEILSQKTGGNPPLPEHDKLDNFLTLKKLSGNELFEAIANEATTILNKVAEWNSKISLIESREKNWTIAEKLVSFYHSEQNSIIDKIKEDRQLLSEPDPIPTLIQSASSELREKLNDLHSKWQDSWEKSQNRLKSDQNWTALDSEQQKSTLMECSLVEVSKPQVDKPEAIITALSNQSLHSWENLIKAIPARTDEALLKAAEIIEPKTQTVQLPYTTLKSDAELENWIDQIRSTLSDALKQGPVVPRI